MDAKQKEDKLYMMHEIRLLCMQCINQLEIGVDDTVYAIYHIQQLIKKYGPK